MSLGSKHIVGKRFITPVVGLSRTKQSFCDECDINNIMASYAKTGLVRHVVTNQGDYADYGDGVDFQACMNHTLAAQEMFLTLPSGIRSRFGNDPAEFLNFVSDPANKPEMEKLGLLAVPKELPVPAPPVPVPPVA